MNELIAFLAKYLIYIIALVGLAYWLTLDRGRKLSVALTGVIAGVIGITATKIAGALYYEPQPFVLHHTQPLIHHAVNNAFPSDHTVVATLAALTVFQASRTVGVSMLVLAIVLGVARVAAQVHSPLDIITSLIIGAAAVAVAVPLTKLILKNRLQASN